MNRPQPTAIKWQNWSWKWREPTVLLAVASVLGGLATWSVGAAVSDAQLHSRVMLLEKHADEQGVTLDHMQEQIARRAESFDSKLNALALQFAAVPPRLDAIADSVKAIRETEAASDQKMTEANRVRDDSARLRDMEWGRRLDTVLAAIRGERH